ncbi:MAG: hypothetical protein HC868_03050 [Sphingomonadales bacterium]|nr:hypothetical protein [Sphingomonadales bacterium]
MSSAELNGCRTDFDDWLARMVRQHREFTVLVILTKIRERSVVPLCSTYLHVIGDEADWNEIVAMFAGSGQVWDGAAFFPTKGPNGGPIDNPTARSRLAELEAKVTEDRMTLNEGHFFDTLGRRIEIEPADDA